MSSGLADLVFDPNGTLHIGPLAVMLDRKLSRDGKETLPAVVPGVYSPTEADDANTIATVPAIQRDFSGGALYSTRIIENGYGYAAPGYLRAARAATPPGARTTLTLPAPSPALGNITDSWEINGDLYFNAGRYALIVDGGSATAATVAQDLGGGFVADGAALFNGAAYIGGSVTWQIPSEGSMLPRLVMGNSALTGIRYTGGDPMSLVNWTPNPSSIPVGDSTALITSIVAAPSHVYFEKEDGGLYDLNSRGETPCLTPDIARSIVSAYNGAASIYHDNFVHAGHATGAVMVDVSQAQRRYGMSWSLPAFGVTNRTPVVGPVVAWALDQGWLVAAVYNQTTDTTYIGAGMRRGKPGVPDGPGPILWHFAEMVVDGRVTHLRTTVVGGAPRLWVASRVGPNIVLEWQYLPDAADPLASLANGTSFRFGDRLVLYTTPFDWGDPDAIKILRVIGLRTQRLGGSASVAVSANAEGGSFTLQDTATTSPRARISPRAPLTQGYEIGMLLVAEGTALNPPVIEAIKVDAEVQTEQFDRRYYPIRVGKHQDLRGGVKDQRNASTVWASVADLHTIGVMEMRDNIQKATLNVRVHPVQQYEAVEDTRIDAYTYSGVLPITILELLEAGATGGNLWGGGSIWGDGSVWGAA
jgi:hypothetical protein